MLVLVFLLPLWSPRTVYFPSLGALNSCSEVEIVGRFCRCLDSALKICTVDCAVTCALMSSVAGRGDEAAGMRQQ